MSGLDGLKSGNAFGFSTRIPIGVVFQREFAELPLNLLGVGGRFHFEVGIVVSLGIRFYHRGSMGGCRGRVELAADEELIV